MPGIRNGFDALWVRGDNDAKAKQACDELLTLAKAGGQVSGLLAKMTRVVEATHTPLGLPS